MALQKEVVTPYGVTANYFKISGIEVNTVLKTADIKLNGYFNEEARLEDSKSLTVKSYRVYKEQYDTYFSTTVQNGEGNNIWKSGYEFIKDTDGDFAGATDV